MFMCMCWYMLSCARARRANLWRHAPNGGVGIGLASSSAKSEVPTRRKPAPPPKEGDAPLKGETPPKSDVRPSRPTSESTPSNTLSTLASTVCSREPTDDGPPAYDAALAALDALAALAALAASLGVGVVCGFGVSQGVNAVCGPAWEGGREGGQGVRV